MEYDRELVDFHYANILNGFTPFIYKSELFLAKHICPSDIFEANAQVLATKEEYTAQHLMSEYEMLRELASSKVWTYEDESEIKTLNSQIDKLRDNIPLLFLPSQKKTAEDDVIRLVRQRDKKDKKRSDLLSQSIEFRLKAEKNEYFIFLGVYRNRLERRWASYKEFLQDDADTTSDMMSCYFKAFSGLNTGIIRAIAKTTDARSRLKSYIVVPAETTTFLLELKQWCAFYDSIYELSDKPDERIIQDDIKLGGWIEARKAKAKAENSVNTDGAFRSFPGANKDDMEALGGADRKTAIQVSKSDWDENGR